ncbi:MAG: stalk domain-containing protein [Cellulosilyticaceae bacterium]
MKKTYRLLMLIFVMNTIMIVNSFASNQQMAIYVDNEKVIFTEATGYPFVDQTGNTLMPLRSVLEKMGATVQWQNNAAYITKDSQVVEVPLGYKYILHNNNKVASSTSAVMKNSKLYIPLRAVVTALGGDINLTDNSTIRISTKTSSNTENFENISISSEVKDLQKNIRTKEQAISYVDQTFDSLWKSYHLWQGSNSNTAVFRSGPEILNQIQKGEAGRSDMATLVAYLLSDDYETGTLYGFAFATDGSLYSIKAVTYINIDGKYHIFDPVVGLKTDKPSQKGVYFKDMVVDSLDKFSDYIKMDIDQSREISQVYAVEGGQGIRFTVDTAKLFVEIDEPSAKLIYSNTNLADNIFDHIKAENIYQYKLPQMLDGLTLTPESAKGLVGKSPEYIKDKVQTAGDLLLYMLASRTLLENGDQQIFADGYEWHYNRTAKEVLSMKKGNCGSTANLAKYLLGDDYEEVGFILHSYYPGEGGGHVYNYIKYNNKYYIIDFSSYLFDNYSVSEEFNVIALDTLQEYGARWNECFNGLAAIVAHDSPGTHLPNVWSGNTYYLPEGATFEVIMETLDNGYVVKTMPMPTEVPDWRKPQ